MPAPPHFYTVHLGHTSWPGTRADLIAWGVEKLLVGAK